MANIALLVVEKEYVGEVFSNTYALSANDPTTAPFTEQDLIKIIGTVPNDWDAATTGTGAPPVGFPQSAVASCVAFDRMMTFDAVRYRRAYLSDGKTVSGSTPLFATFNLSFGGLAGSSMINIAPLSLALQVNRNPEGYSSRSGRILFRGALAMNDVEPAPHDGVQLRPDAVGRMRSRLADAVNNSGMLSLLSFDNAEDVQLVIPHYNNVAGSAQFGTIVGGTEVLSLTIGDAISRQVPRGRRRRRT